MNERTYSSGVERLRSKERTERMQVEKVADLCTQEFEIKSLLDIGTGSGLFAEEFDKRNISVTGVDLNPEMIEAARKYLPLSKFEVAPAESLPFPEKSFDLVFMGLVFHEVDDYKKVLEEAKRVAVKAVAVYDWNYEMQNFGPPIEHRVKSDFIEQLALQAGFTGFKSFKLTYFTLYILKK